MKDHQLLDFAGEDDHDPSRAAFCWWTSASKYEECKKIEFRNLSKITARQKVLREMERLALIAPEGLNELRNKIYAYRPGDFWVSTGGFKKEEMDIPPAITILLVGFHNAGKSSLVNLMYSVLGRSGLIPFAQTSSGKKYNYPALSMEEHNVLRSTQSGFCVYDTKGFEHNRVGEGLEELSEWMTDGVHHQQLSLRPTDKLLLDENHIETSAFRSSSKFAIRKVNCVMVVANAAEIYMALKAGDKKPLEATRLLFCSTALWKCNENPILILTHGDKLLAEERIDARLKICERLGVSESTGVYDIVCTTEYGFLADEFDPISAYSVTEAIYRALLVSDRGHLPKKNFQDWAVLVLSLLMCSISAFFSFLAHLFSALGRRN